MKLRSKFTGNIYDVPNCLKVYNNGVFLGWKAINVENQVSYPIKIFEEIEPSINFIETPCNVSDIKKCIAGVSDSTELYVEISGTFVIGRNAVRRISLDFNSTKGRVEVVLSI